MQYLFVNSILVYVNIHFSNQALESNSPLVLGCTLCNDHRVIILEKSIRDFSLAEQEDCDDDENEYRENKSNSTCVVCFEAPKCILLMPCKHLCLCENCSERIEIKNCPICRNTVKNKIKIFV